jgi:hypothetical protein
MRGQKRVLEGVDARLRGLWTRVNALITRASIEKNLSKRMDWSPG